MIIIMEWIKNVGPRSIFDTGINFNVNHFENAYPFKSG